MEPPPAKLRIAISFDTLYSMINCIIKNSNNYKEVSDLYKVYADNNNYIEGPETSDLRDERDLKKWRKLLDRFREKRVSLKNPIKVKAPIESIPELSDFPSFGTASFTSTSPTPFTTTPAFDFSFTSQLQLTPLSESFTPGVSPSGASTSSVTGPLSSAISPLSSTAPAFDFSFGSTFVQPEPTPTVDFQQFVDFNNFDVSNLSGTYASHSGTSSEQTVPSLEDIERLINEGTPEALESATLAIAQRRSLGLTTGQEFGFKESFYAGSKFRQDNQPKTESSFPNLQFPDIT